MTHLFQASKEERGDTDLEVYDVQHEKDPGFQASKEERGDTDRRLQ